MEQLVEVPTILSHASLSFLQVLQRNVEQNVDIPVVGGSGAHGGLSRFLPGQNFSMTAEQIVDNPVRPGGAGDLQGCPRGQGSTAFSKQIPEFPDPGGGRQDFQPVQGSAASSSDLPGQAGAHGRRRLMTRPWCLRKRRSPRTSLSSLSTCSTMGVGGGCEWTQLTSGIAGG